MWIKKVTHWLRAGAVALALEGSMDVNPLSQPAHAGVASKVLQEGIEATTRVFGREVAQEGLETLTKKMSSLAAKHGDDIVATAFRTVGPRTAGRLVAEVGEEQAGLALRLLAKHADSAIPVITRKSSLGLIQRYGDDAAEAFVRHGGIAEPIIEQFGTQGAKMLTSVTTDQSARRLAVLAKNGALRPDMVELVIAHSDRACEFLWKNRGVALTTAAIALVASSPDEYFDGISQLTSAVLQPIAEIPQAVAVEAARQVNWTGLGVCLIGALMVVMMGLAGMWEHRSSWCKWGGVGVKAAWHFLTKGRRA